MIDWKPIDQLTEDWLMTQEEILLFDGCSHVGSVSNSSLKDKVHISIGDFENDEYFNDITKRYSYFAELSTPIF